MLLSINRHHKAQNILVYAALITVVATTLLIMAPYIQRRIQGVYKQAGDGYGDEEQ